MKPVSIWRWAYQKARFWLQYLLEVVLVAAIALVISFGTSTVISHQIRSSLLSQVTSETYETVNLTGENEAGGRTRRGFEPCRD